MATGGSINTDVLSDETFEILCSICKNKGNNCDAEKYCMNCNDYYCLACVKVHEDVPYLSGHKILDKGQFKTRKVLSDSQQGSGHILPAAPTERCNIHNHYYIDMYCQNHDDVGCATCIATNHRSCKDTFYIPEFLQNNASTPTSDETAQILEGVAKILTKSNNNIQYEKQKLLKAKEVALEDIRTFRKEIEEQLNKLEQNSINEIESLYKASIIEIEKATKEVQTNQYNIESAQHKLASAGNNLSQVFVNVIKGNKAANMTSKWIEENETYIHMVDIGFKADQRLSKFLEEMDTLGVVVQRNMKDEGNMASSVSEALDQQAASSQSPKQKKYPPTSGSIQQGNVLFQVIRQKNYMYNIKVWSDEYDCNIVSACELEDGTIILSDNNNNRLKRLGSSTYAVKDYLDLYYAPWQVCAISKQEVAVCLYGCNKVQFISVGRRMEQSREINTDCGCYGLAYADDNLYVSDYTTSVYIYSMTGRKLKQFKVDQSGQELFSNIRSLAVSKDGSRIYVADYQKGLIVLDNNGQVVRVFNGPQLEAANCCYLTDKGSLLVSGYISRNILQFGPDGELIGEILKSNKDQGYWAVCCNQQMSKLIVGSKSNKIEGYNLAKCI